MGSGLPKPIGIGSLDARIRHLEERVKLMDGARRLAAATISEGGLTVVDGGGVILSGGGSLQWRDSEDRQRLFVGPTVVDGERVGEGMLMLDTDGTAIFISQPGYATFRARGSTAAAIIESDNSINLNADSSINLNADSSINLNAANNVNLNADSNFAINSGNNRHRVYSTSNDLYLTAPSRVGVLDANFYVWGDLDAAGTKDFVIPHPLDPENRTLRHAATESPNPGLEYSGEATIGDDGTATIELPAYFEALTRAEGRTVQLTPIDTPAPLAASRPADGQFVATGPPGAEFYWHVRAIRDIPYESEIDEPAPQPEPDPDPEPEPEPLIEDSPMVLPEEG